MITAVDTSVLLDVFLPDKFSGVGIRRARTLTRTGLLQGRAGPV